MATYKTPIAEAQDSRASSRTGSVSARDIQQIIKYATFTATLTAPVVNGDIFKLGSLQIEGAVIIPELCTLVAAIPSTTAINLVGKIQSVTGTAAAVDESANVTLNTGSALFVKPARKTNGTNTVLGVADYLRFLVGTLTTGGAVGDTITFEIAYRSAKTSH